MIANPPNGIPRVLMAIFANLFNLFPQHFLHRPTLGKLIDQLIHISNLLHQWIFNFSNLHATYRAGNELGIGVDLRRLEEIPKSRLIFQVLLQSPSVESGQPRDDLN